MTDTTNCELCGRGMAQRALTPYWWDYDTVCDRARCRSAARDAVLSVEQARARNRELVGAIAARHKTQPFAVAWRHDTMAKIDVVDNEQWWPTDSAKVVRK